MANRHDVNRSFREQERFSGPLKRSVDSSARPYDDTEPSGNELSSYRPSDDGRLAYGDRQDRSSYASPNDRSGDHSAYTRADQGTRNDPRRTSYDRYSSQNDYSVGSDGTVPSSRGGYDRYASQQQDYGMGSDNSARFSDMHGRDMANRNSFDENDYGRQSLGRVARSNPASTYQGSTYESSLSAGAYGTTRSHAGRGPKNWQRSDENIREQACDRLEQDHGVDASEIEVTVASGVVTLSGKVDTRSTKRRAEDIVEGLAGVKDVRNELSVDQSFWQQAKDVFTGADSKPADKLEANSKSADKFEAGLRASTKSATPSTTQKH